LLNWFFVIKTNHYFVQEMVINTFIPGILAGIALMIWINPGLSVLRRTQKGSTLRMVYQVIALSAMVIPTLFAQYYMHASLGKLTVFDDSTQVQQTDVTKYYQFKHFYVDKSAMSIYPSFEISGKRHEEFSMTLSIAMPIYTDKSQAVSAWLGESWHKTIGNHPTEIEKEKQFHLFLKKTLVELEKSDLNHPGYLERADHLHGFNLLQKAMQKNPKYIPGKSFLFIAYSTPYSERAEDYKNSFKLSIILLGGLWLLLVIFSKQDAVALGASKNISIKKYAFFKQLSQTKYYPITIFLIGINCLEYLIMFFKDLNLNGFDAEELLFWGANFRHLTVEQHEWWRLLTSMFLHNGFFHLLPNMGALYFCGIFLEPLIGKIKYLVVYLVTGVVAGCVSLWWHEATISIGASGAIFGLFGVLIALLAEKNSLTVFTERSAILIQFAMLATLGLLTGLMGFVDNADHIGGFVCGLCIGLMLRPKYAARIIVEY